jgi:sugar O-acyltransferase (sialic acid O-acetyltransferase NeuD family)
MAKIKLFIFPFNGNGVEAVDCIDFERYDLIGFIDDSQGKTSAEFDIFPRSILVKYPEVAVLAVPGGPNSFKERGNIIKSLKINENRFVNVIHHTATIGKNVKIGHNCLIMAGAVITSNAILHNHICILPNTVIHHDVFIEDFAIIGSNVVIGGSTKVGQNSYIGSGTNVINGIQIGGGALIGLGSNVIRSIPTNSKVLGNPAKEVGLIF